MKPDHRNRKALPFVLGKTEVAALLAVPNVRCATGLRNRAMLAAMAGAGLRVSEVTALRPGGIRWEPADAAHGGGFIEVRNGKGGRDRTVPINAETLGWLSAWRERRPAAARRFFCTLKGGRIMSRYVQAYIKRIAHRAGLENADRVSPHTLRHSYATTLLDDGFTIRDVQALLGHSSIATTQIYLHVRPKELAAKIQRGVLVNNVAPKPEIPADVRQLAERLAAMPPDARRVLTDALKALEDKR